MRFNPHAVSEKKDRGGGKPHREGRFCLRRPVEVKSVAIVLAGLMIFSVFGANVSSIVKLFTAEAATSLSEYTYYDAGFTLYDYHSNGYSAGNPSGYNGNTNLNDSGSHSWTRFDAFNQKLYDDASHYVKDAGGKDGYNTTGHKYSNASGEINNLMPDNAHPTTYFPLYLGWQHNTFSQVVNSEGIKGNPTKYNYSLSANAQACDGSQNAAAAQGLVNDKLNGSNLITQGGTGNVHVLPYFDESFLTGDIANKLSGSNDKFRFRYHTSGDYAGYYVYDSRYDGLVRSTSGGVTTLSAVAGSDTGITGYERYNDNYNNPGFFPAGDHNFGFGAIFDIDFTMTEDGKTVTNEDMVFNFSGDDDVWVYIDGRLVLDIGGAHGRVSGNINFAKGTNYVSARKKTSAYEYSKAQNKIGTGDIDFNVTEDISDILNGLGLYSDPTKTHKLRVFYLERGHQESNCMITFNFHQADTLTISNKIDATAVNDWFRTEAVAVAESEAIEYQLANNGLPTTQDSPDDGVDDYSHEIKKINPSETSETVSIQFYNPNSNGAGWSDTPWKTKSFAKGHRVLLPTPTREYYEFMGWTKKKYNPVTMKILNSDGTDSDTDFDPTTDILYGGNKPSNAVLVEDDMFYSYWEVAPVTFTDGNLGKIKNAYGYVFWNRNGLNGNATNNLNDSESYSGKYFIRNMTKHFGKYPGESLSDTTVFSFQWSGDPSSCEYPTANWFHDHSGLTLDDNTPYKWGWQENYFLIMDTTPNYNYSYRVKIDNGNLVSNDSTYDTLSLMDAPVKAYLKELLMLHSKLTSTRASLIAHGEYTGADAVAARQLKEKYDAALSQWNDAIKFLNTNETNGTNIQKIINLIKSIDPGYTTTTGTNLDAPPVLDPDEIIDDPDGNGGDGDGFWTEIPVDPSDDPYAQTGDPEPQTGDPEPQTGDPEPQTGDPEGGSPSGGIGDPGHWTGSDGTHYKYVTNTNYRTKWIGYTDSGIRKTSDSGGIFTLTGNQLATFTVQFTRDSNLKVAPNGNSILLPYPGRYVYDSSNASATPLSNEGDHPLSTRYSTKWQIYDNQVLTPDGTPDLSSTGHTSKTDGYSARTAFSKTWTTVNNPSVSDQGEYSFLMDYVDQQASENDFVDVYVDYYNKILTGDLTFKKTVADGSSVPDDKEFTFVVEFEKIFGGNSATTRYTGAYTHKDAAGTATNKTATSGVIKLKKDESFVITGIPVDTHYQITELTDKDDNQLFVEGFKTGSVTIEKNKFKGTVNPDVYSADDTIQPVPSGGMSENGYNAYVGKINVAVNQSGNLKFIFDENPDPDGIYNAFTQNSDTGKYEYTTSVTAGSGNTFGAMTSITYCKKLTDTDKTPFVSDFTIEWSSPDDPPPDDALCWHVDQTYAVGDTSGQGFILYDYCTDGVNHPVSGDERTVGTVSGIILAANRGVMIDGTMPDRNEIPPVYSVGSSIGGGGEGGGNGAITDEVTGVMATYTPYTVLQTDYQEELKNEIVIPVNNLIIRKTITQNYYSQQDDPAGLLSETLNRFDDDGVYVPTFGGATGSSIDPNGYQQATGAQQTFIFKITEYSDASFADDKKTGKVFYESISFDKNDITVDNSSTGKTKFKALKVPVGKHYKVEEVTDWSWKYELNSMQCSVSAASNTAHQNDNSLPINHKIENIGYFSVFDEKLSPDNDDHKYSNAAMASFENIKNTLTNNVEGDTDYCINSLTHE